MYDDPEVVWSATVRAVINRCYGGFCLSDEAAKALELPASCRVDVDFWILPPGMRRSDPRLVEVVERLGSRAGGRNTKLVVETWDVSVGLRDHDGKETLCSL